MKEKGKLLIVSLIGIFVLIYGSVIDFNLFLLAVLYTIPFLLAA